MLDTDEKDDGVDNGKNFEDVIRRARLARRHRLPVDRRRTVVFVVRHRFRPITYRPSTQQPQNDSTRQPQIRLFLTFSSVL